MKNRVIKALTFFIPAVWISACQLTYHSLQAPLPLVIPSKFRAQEDTTSIAQQSWKEFFKDEYLEALIETALVYNRNLQIAMQRIEASQALYLASKGQLLPSLHLITSAGVDKFGKYTMNGVGNFDTNLSGNISEDLRIPTNPTPDFFVGFRSSWELDIWGKLRNTKKANSFRILASQAYKNMVITELVAQIGILYYELVAIDSELRVIERNTLLQQQMLNLIKAQKEAGKATSLAVQQAEAQLLRTQSLEFSLKNQIIALENQINFLLGRSPQPVLRTPNFMEKPLLVVSYIGVPAQMLQLRPDVREAELQLAAANYDYYAAQAALWPTLQLNTYTALNAFSIEKFFNPASFAYGIASGLTTPIFQYHQLKANKKIAQTNAYSAYLNYQNKVLSALNEVNTLLQTLENLEKIYSLREQELSTLRKAVESSKNLFFTGFANYLEVITAQKGVLEAEIDLFEIRKNQFNTAIQIYKALGGGWQ
ncbi:MAG: efflux transporter outer membrane subunit [Bacteroidia bacterium]|nr:efflux transporter outer membrane subunit [Bacteroidia bacterium]